LNDAVVEGPDVINFFLRISTARLLSGKRFRVIEDWDAGKFSSNSKSFQSSALVTQYWMVW
jgi:hypothetical protein